MVPIGRIARSRRVALGPNRNLLTSRWSPTRRLFSIEPVGILNACTTNVRMKSARMTAMTIDSKYSRSVDFGCVVVAMFYSRSCQLRPTGTLLADLQYREKRLLRDLDLTHPFHALLAFLLLLEQFPLARDVAAIALRQDVLPQRLDRLARDDAR